MGRQSAAASAIGLKPCCCATHSLLGRKFKSSRSGERLTTNFARSVMQCTFAIVPACDELAQIPAAQWPRDRRRGRKRLTAISVQRCSAGDVGNDKRLTMTKLIACSLGALLLAGNLTTASAQS